MKFIKKILLAILLLLILGFSFFFIEFDFGVKYPSDDKCTIPTGRKKVYVHWLKPLNNTISNFCNGEATPYFHITKDDESYKCHCQ